MEAQQLIPIDKSQGGKDVVNARLLHEFLEVGTEFAKWFTRRVEEYGFTEGADFSSSLAESTGGRQAQEFAITLDMAKELSMVERTEKGHQARRYFIDCEKKLRGLAEAPRPALPTSFKEALQALLIEVEQKEVLEQQLALAAPKLAFVASIDASQNAVSFAQAAKYLKIPGCEGRNKLINRLRVEGVLMKSREPYQRHIDKGRFEVQPQTFKAGQKGERITGTTKVTPKGLQWLAKKLRGEEVED